jgi:2-keto-3-deoxy-L-rhamnonate aldolase RhmA
MRFTEYVEAANEQTVVVVQAEHAMAVANVESIVKVPGIDAVLLGPYDLSASLGKMGQVEDAEVVAAIERVTTVCREAQMPLGYFGVTAGAVQPYVERGYTLIVAGVDTLFLGIAASKLLAELRG